ncbi:MAG: trigger factor [Pseudomarimonas sp.]
MEVVLENLGKLERRLTARVSGQQLEAQVRARLLELARTVSIKGFRPGKIPASVIEQRFGAQVRSEAMAASITSSLQEALLQEHLRPALAPAISARPIDGGDIEYTADFEVLPELGPISVTNLALTKCVAHVEEADVDRAIEALRRQHGPAPGLESASSVNDEALLERLGVRYGGMEWVRDEVRSNLERDLATAIAARNKAEALHHLLDAFADLDVPKGLVEIEKNERFAHAQRNAVSAKVAPPADVADFTAEAQSRVRAFILLTEIARQNAIAPEQTRINAALAEIAARYVDPENVVQLYVQDTELMASLRNQVIETQVIEWIVANAKVTERTLAFSEVMLAND